MNPSHIPIKANDSFVSRNVDTDLLVVNQDKGKIHQLNTSASFIWNLIDGKTTVGEIISKSFEEFEIERDQVVTDVSSTLEKLIELNLIEMLEH